MKKIKSISVILMTFLLANSCLVDDEQSQQEVNQANTPIVVGFSKSIETISHFSDIGTVENIIRMVFLGGGKGFSETDLEIPFEIDSNSTAQQGIEFNLNSSSIILPAHRDFGELPISVNTGSFNPNVPTELILNLLPGNVATTTDMQRTIKIIFIGCQSDISNFSYQVDISRDDGATWNHGIQNIISTDVNTFKTITTGGWAAGTIAPDQGYSFIDICGDITVPSQGLAQGFYSNTVRGLTSDGTDGEVFPNGDIRIIYEISFTSGNRTYTNYYTKQ